MQIKLRTIGNINVVTLTGVLERSTRGRMELEFLALADHGAGLILDLSGVDFVSSAWLHLFLNLHRRCQSLGGGLALIGLSDQIREILTTTGFTPGLLNVYDSLEEGLYAIQAILSAESQSRGFSETVSEPGISFDIPKMGAKEEVNFSAFYPKEVPVEKWHTLLVYTYVPHILDAVREDARKFKDEIGEIHESKPVTNTKLARGTEITIVPACEGVTFNPEHITFQWLEDQHRALFRLRANADMADLAETARVTVYVGPLIVGTLKMGLNFVEAEAGSGAARSAEVSGKMYHQDNIFISYSHKDTEIVRGCKRAYEALGHNVLIDFETLRSGQKWNPELMRMIQRADIFQLFWSENSSQSEFCRQEWQYALQLKRGEGFIRPVYWNEPIPTPPAELNDIHFDFAPFTIQN